MKKRISLPTLGALTLLAVCLFASCEDGYIPSGPHITFNKSTLDLTANPDDALIITVAIPSKLRNNQYIVTWDGDIGKIAVYPYFDPEDPPSPNDPIIIDKDDPNYDPEPIEKTTVYSVIPKPGESAFSITITVNKIIYDDDGSVIPDSSASPVKEEINVTVN